MNSRSQTTGPFELPERLAFPSPTETRNLRRDEVRLLVSSSSGALTHDIFSHIDQYLKAGDVLVVNTSAMIPAALPVSLPGGRAGMLHMSTQLQGREWVVEIREIVANKTVRWKRGDAGMRFELPGKAYICLKKRYYQDHRLLDLWIAELYAEGAPLDYLSIYGQPVRYDHLNESWPLSYYQSVFSFHPGSVEMPSASRGFTAELVQKLLGKGIIFVPVLLHCGVSSLEEHEKPYPEYMEMSPLSAMLINEAKAAGGRIIAVGTTAVRAVESAADAVGRVEALRGETDLFIRHSGQLNVIDGLLTGFHEPRSSHLSMLQALAGFDHIDRAYQAAIATNYLWHEFGDLHLILG